MKKQRSSTETEVKHGIRIAPRQLLVSTMIQASNEDLQKLINEELQKNVALESDDSRSIDEMNERDTVDGSEDSDFQGDSAELDGTDSSDITDRQQDENDVVDLPDYSEDDLPIPVQKDPNEKEFTPLSNYGSDTSFRESLKQQLAVLELPERDAFIANYIVDSLEDDGYLRRPLSELVDDLAWNQNFDTDELEIQRVLIEVVQANLEPVGVGARDLKECLLLQLDELQSNDATMKAYDVLDKSFDDFMARRFDIIKENHELSDRDIAAIQKVIHKLNPKPGGLTSTTDAISTKASMIRLDFIVTNEDGELFVSLCNSRIPAVRISPDYKEMLTHIQNDKTLGNEEVEKGKAFIKKGIRSANTFIYALVQRRNTMLRVMRSIVRIQYKYFLSGNIEDLCPMVLREVAALAKCDYSTVSRVCSNRYVQTDFAILPLKSLFSQGFKMAGKTTAISSTIIKNALKDIVDNEDKSMPYNDDELQKRLAQLGYNIARRTVVKYRLVLGIPRYEARMK